MSEDTVARKRLKQKVLQRWENEGGKIEPQPKEALGNNPKKDHEVEANHSSPSNENPVRISDSSKAKRETR
jgi:hypothetical protein